MGVRYATGIWLGVVTTGFLAWHVYDATPEDQDQPDRSIAQAGAGPSVRVYLHPHCPCSRATLAELAEILPKEPVGGEVAVVFVLPEGVPHGWERAELWDRATRLPGVSVRIDPAGAEARAAGARTSGYVVAIDSAGHVAFRGGITRGRSAVGDNLGRRAVAAVMAGRVPEVRESPVFGCALFTPGQCVRTDSKECDR